MMTRLIYVRKYRLIGLVVILIVFLCFTFPTSTKQVQSDPTDRKENSQKTKSVRSESAIERGSELRTPEENRQDSTKSVYEQTSVDVAKSTYQQNDEFVNMTMIRNASLIFVGGYYRSGTTLMRAILDVHSDIRCGPETMMLVPFLQQMTAHINRGNASKIFLEAGLEYQTIDDCMALFTYHLLANHGPKAPILCAKDPLVLEHIGYLHQLFPNAKFVYMIRDGRAAAYSQIIKYGANVTASIFEKYLKNWNVFNRKSYEQCEQVGSEICMRVKYDDLILKTNKTVENVIRFLNVPWQDKLLEHQKYVGSEIVVSNMEWSSDQIKKPIYNQSLTSWQDKIPYLNETYVRRIAPMLEKLGYNLSFSDSVIEKQRKNQ